MSESTMNWRSAGQVALIFGLSIVCASCGVLPRDDVEVDRSFYVGHCLPHKLQTDGKELPVGPTDMTLDSKGVLYVSSHDNHLRFGDDTRRVGGIYRYDVARDGKIEAMKIQSQSLRLPGYFEKNFFPGGISVLEMGGEKRLFVVNHRISKLEEWPDDGNLANVFDWPPAVASQSYVEIFRVVKNPGGEVLVHERTIESSSVEGGLSPYGGRAVALSDIVAVGPQQFFVTNNPRGIIDKINIMLFHNSLGNVLYFDGERYRVVADGIDFGKGINIGADNKVLYVATMRHGEMIAYETNLKPSGELQPENVTLSELPPRVRLEGHLDNIEWLDGRKRELLVATHENLATVELQRLRAPVESASRIVRVGLADSGGFDKRAVKLLYANEGTQISAASVATYYKDDKRERLIVGSLFGEGFLVCKFEAH